MMMAGVVDLGGTIPLPSSGNHMAVPCKLEGTFIVPLAYENLGGRVLEVADKIERISWPRVSLENTEYIVESSPRVFAPKGIRRGVMGIDRWVLVEH